MPNANHPYTETLTFAGRVIPLKRPMAEYAARRLQAILLRSWLDITGTQWVNLKVRGPYNRHA